MKSLSDNLSFYRLGLLWNYYSKWIYSQAIIYAIIIVFIYLLSLSASYYIFVFWLVSGTGQSILSMLFYVGPLIFAIPANRKAEIMLPASVTEKITFYLGYTFIAVPAFISILWLTCIGIGCIFSDHGNVQALYNEGMSLYSIFTFSETGTPLSYLTDAMLSILMPATSLYAIIKARRLRVLWGIGGVAIAFFTKILIAIAVIVSTIVIYALADTPETGEEDASINYLYMINPLISIICFVIGIIIIVLTAKMLARRTA